MVERKDLKAAKGEVPKVEKVEKLEKVEKVEVNLLVSLAVSRRRSLMIKMEKTDRHAPHALVDQTESEYSLCWS